MGYGSPTMQQPSYNASPPGAAPGRGEFAMKSVRYELFLRDRQYCMAYLGTSSTDHYCILYTCYLFKTNANLSSFVNKM